MQMSDAPQQVGELDRAKYLGGSDAPGVIGVSPWKTPVDVFLDKIRPRSETNTLDPAKAKFFARRKRQEPVIAEMLADEYGIVVDRLSLDNNPNRYRDQEFPFMAAEIDYEFRMNDSIRRHFESREEFCAIPNGTTINGEIKTVHPFASSEWGEQGTEDVPIHYAAQGMHGLGVTRRPAVMVAALFGLDTLMCFPIMRDDETIAAMRAKCATFWRDNVLKRIPPDPVNLDDIKRLYARFAGRPCFLNDDAEEALRQIDLMRRRQKQAAEDLAAAEWTLAKFIADAWGKPLVNDDGKLDVEETDNAVLYYGDVEVGSWKRQRGSYLDQRRLKTDRPEMVEAYTVDHHFRVFRLKKPKGQK